MLNYGTASGVWQQQQQPSKNNGRPTAIVHNLHEVTNSHFHGAILIRNYKKKVREVLFDHVLLRNLLNSNNTARLISFCHNLMKVWHCPLSCIKLFGKQFVLSQSNCFGLALASAFNQDTIDNGADE